MSDTQTALEESKTPETAMNGLVGRVRFYYQDQPRLDRPWSEVLDAVCEMMRRTHRQLFTAALQDPRYIAYCKEQDRKEAKRPRPLYWGDFDDWALKDTP